MSKKSAAISVIIPCYNHGHFLPHALNSILKQTFVDWEAIVVDDGSTDDTAETTKNYSDPRIHYIYQENAGLSAARNSGVRAATGGLLAFLDADDEWEPEFLAACCDQLEKEPELAGVFTRCAYIDPDGNRLPTIGGLVVEPSRFRQRLLQGGFFPPNAILIHAAILEKTGLFDTSLTSVEDWDLWLRISALQTMRGISPPLARYRVYPGSMSTNTGRMHDNRVAVLTKLFGEPTGDSSIWSEEKRMSFGCAYQATGLGYISQEEEDLGWHWLEQAFSIWPSLLDGVDIFYELVCKAQPRGHRGIATTIDIPANTQDMFVRLDSIWENGSPELLAHQSKAVGNANVAAAMLYDQANNWSKARKHLIAAVKENKSLLRDTGIMRRLAKVTLLTPRLLQAIRSNRATADS